MDKDTLKNKVLKGIITLIVSGEYVDGQALPAERKLANEFGVSRGTLRKALEELQELGVVDIKAGSGIYVKQLSFANVPKEVLPPDIKNISLREIMVARKAIELAALEFTLPRITDEELGKLQDILTEMAYSVSNVPRYIQLDMEFHEYLVECSGNPVLLSAYKAIDEYNRYLQVVTAQNEECEESALNYHLQIFASVQKRDISKAKKLMEEHLDNVVDQMK